MAYHRKKGRALPTIPNDLTTQLVHRINNLPSDHASDYLKEVLLSKYNSPDPAEAGIRRSRAIFKWLCTEMVNESTNERLLLLPEEYNILPRVTFGRFVEQCRDLIRDIIGDTPPLEALIGSFSGGASTSRSRASSTPAGKYVGKAHVTQRCLDWYTMLGEPIQPNNRLSSYDGGCAVPALFNRQNDLLIEVVPGNVMFTVAKNADIDRVACKEPDLNMFIQKGVGDYFRKSLRRIGINLNDQSYNRSLAHLGSITGDLATLDLSSASDSVTEGLVALFLPETWYTLLDAVRCHVTIIDGDEHRNHMFSSMGNGFTFELESLLFYVIGKVTARVTGTRGIISVYGDDIVCPADMATDLIWVLGIFGFATNEAKSFISGPFRESCGGHYYNGRDITPFYIKSDIKTLADIIDVANKLRKWAGQGLAEDQRYFILDLTVEEVWLWLKSYIPDVLWGGEDLSFKFQLVSNDISSHRIVETVRRKDAGPGGYLHWLNSTWRRTESSDGISTSTISQNSGEFRLRPVRIPTVPRLFHLFLSEVR